MSEPVTRKEFEDNLGWIKEAISEVKEQNKEMGRQLSALLIVSSKQNSRQAEADKKDNRSSAAWGSYKLTAITSSISAILAVMAIIIALFR